MDPLANSGHGGIFWQSLQGDGLHGVFPCEVLPSFALEFRGLAAKDDTYGVSEAYCQVLNQESSLQIPLDEGKTYNLGLTLTPTQARSMAVLVNDTHLDTFHFLKNQHMQTFNVLVPGELVKELNTVTFRSQQTTGVANSSHNAVLIEFESFAFETVSGIH
jgi:hypothetical protein